MRVRTILALIVGTLVGGELAMACFWCDGRLPQPGSANQTSREQQLWKRISALGVEPPASQPYERHLEAVLDRRRELLEQLRVYAMLYPGGAHRDEAVRIELQTLFDIGSRTGGDYGPLCDKVDAYLKAPPSDSALHEAAYWAMICARVARTAATTQPSSKSVRTPREASWEEYRRYVERYPTSRHVPRLAQRLFEHALRRGDRDEMRRLVERVSAAFPKHAVTEGLRAQLRREDAVGKLFWITFRDVDGRMIDTRERAGQPVVIVVWAAFEAGARRTLSEIEALRRQNSELVVVGVNLDATREEMTAVSTELGLAWPQFHDGRGWANAFARRWGVRRVPRVFVIDRSGRLLGSTLESDWKRLATVALEP